MEFNTTNKTINKNLRHGDINEIIKRSRLSRETVRASLKLKTLVGATENQIKVWEVATALLQERKETAKEIENKISSIAKKL